MILANWYWYGNILVKKISEYSESLKTVLSGRFGIVEQHHNLKQN